MQRSSRGAAVRGRLVVCALALSALLACAALSAASALALGAESGSLQQLAETEGQTETTTTATTATTSSSETGNSHTTILLAAGAAVLLLCGVGFVIVRDARRVAPATEAEIVDARTGRSTGSTMRKRRAKAKAARAQRKRNR